MKNMIKKISLVLVVAFVMTLSIGNISIHAANIKISKKYAVLEVDAILQLSITGTNSTVKWSTSDKKIAGVTKKGKVVAYKEGTATITASVGGSKYSCEVTVVDSNKDVEESIKPSSKGVPTLKDSDAFTVLGSYTYKDTFWGYQYFVYLVEAKKTTEAEIKLVISDKNGNVLDTCSDKISLTKGKQNYFQIVTDSKYVDSNSKYSMTSKNSSSYHTGDEDAVKIIKYNKTDDNLYVTVKQTKENLGPYAELKMLFFNGDKLVGSEDCYYSVYAEDLESKGDESIMSIWIYGVDYTNVEFFFEDR